MTEGPIEACIRRIASEDSSGYYRPLKAIDEAKALGYTPLIYWIIGARRIGKTDFFLRLACRLWQDDHKQTMWLRNKDVELSEPGFYADFLNDAKTFGWCPEDWSTDNRGVFDGEGNQVIKWQALSTFSNRRGAAHPDVYMLVYDEFCPEDRRYPKHALKGLMSLSKTVLAGKTEARIFCLSNIISLANPFFAGLQIYPGEENITHYPDKAMLIEKCRGYRCSIDSANPWQAVYKAARYGDYADESEDSLINLCKKLPKRSRPLPYAILIGGQIYLPYDTKEAIHWTLCSSQPPYGTQLYAADITEVSDRVPIMPNFMRKNIETCVESNAIRFDSPNTLFSIMSMVYNV